jgi:hypothetical protein
MDLILNRPKGSSDYTGEEEPAPFQEYERNVEPMGVVTTKQEAVVNSSRPKSLDLG